jgi:hypothetical protein
MRKKVNEALEHLYTLAFRSEGDATNQKMITQAKLKLKQELGWLDYYSEHIDNLENKLDRIEEVVEDKSGYGYDKEWTQVKKIKQILEEETK